MTQFNVALIGTGPEPDNVVWGESAAMAYRHGDGYRNIEGVDLMACADIVRENALAFAEEFNIPEANVHEDYVEMLAAHDIDLVSICTPVPTHADLVVGAAETGNVDAIHCEKPMADRWGDCLRMAEAAEETDVQVTFNHQRRFDPNRREAKTALDDGRIGDLVRIEMGGKNIFDFGTHLVDLCNYYNGERGAEWVIGQVDYRTEDVRYGTHNENQSLALWAYDNGVHGLASTGYGTGAEAIRCHHRLVGTEGTIEVQPDGADVGLLVRSGGGIDEIDLSSDTDTIQAALQHVIDCLEASKAPNIAVEEALRATEIIFGVWESSRRRGRVELPLDIDDNPLEGMVEAGDLDPGSEDGGDS